MRFLHTADWHIGKQLHGFSLLEEQQDAYQQLRQIAQEENVDAMVIAGDLYDRKVPSEDAVNCLNGMLVDLNRQLKMPVLAISGNHDSATRLSTGQEWFSATDFYLNTTIKQSLTPVVMGNTQFFLLPYFEPHQVRETFHDESIRTVQDGMTSILSEMTQRFDADKRHVLVAHFFAAGSTHTDSETLVEVGGLNAIPVDQLSAFDYVALGHLHRKEALNEATVKYSGSPLKFSTSEAEDVKGCWIVDTETNPVTVTFRAITPLHDLVILKNSYDQLMDPNQTFNVRPTDYVAIQLTDSAPIPNVMEDLKRRFPQIIELTRVNPRQLTTPSQTVEQIKQNPTELLSDFYHQVTGEKLSVNQKDWAASALVKAEGELGNATY
ncbi:exonuclease SbcCD subunit D [Levilactobacillus bambusae]|uniref:Nuclease SbcCD subunit D n=1 Tax=Levilactobacillus bambusae TaxID=2024736 RepID=A0A2V1MZA4_9LACO|nr:exonuclease SbcCD subunit D [Levilactobacillus bambusae]PWG00152.1 exonuclease sbcCD subunit D [Levilactobacillus bambusae]